jgi:membrane protease YdiL (CAAX protease family)
VLQLGVIAVGFGVQIIAFRAVATGRYSLWTLTGPVLAATGLVAALVRPPIATGRVSAVAAVAAGVSAALALYLGTLAFVAVAARWEVFRSQVADQYGRAGEVSLALALALAILLAVPGEELFWRGLVQPRLQRSLPTLTGPALAWLGYVAANAASGSLPLTAGAVVGGAVWGGLALWTRGVLASVLCHATWTGLMLIHPPASARVVMRG